jgi:hypothetical protein
VIAPPSLCASFIGARLLRVTLVDACGRPVWGPLSQVVSKGFVSVEIAPEVESGESFKVKNAAGELCVNDRGQDSVSWYTLTIEFCAVDPDLFLMMNRTWKRVTDASRVTTTGWRQGERFSDTLGYSLELWPKVTGAGAGQACLLDAGVVVDPTLEPGGYLLMPWVVALAPESVTFANAAVSFKQKGRTRPGSLWGVGPYLVTRDVDGEPSRLLDPIDPGFDVPGLDFLTTGDPDHLHTEIITLAPPVAVCGAQPLWNPDAVAPILTATATVAVARSVDLTVTNFVPIGSSGTVHWGDGTSEAFTTATESHLYAVGLVGLPQTITFYAANGAAPVTAMFTP